MIFAVYRMRKVIKRTKDLFPSENAIIIHVLLLTLVTTLWLLETTFQWFDDHHAKKFKTAKTACTQESINCEIVSKLQKTFYEGRIVIVRISMAYHITDFILAIFILFMLHRFANFQATVLDPVTKQEVPGLSMFQTAATLESSLNKRALTDFHREQLKKELDYEEARAILQTVLGRSPSQQPLLAIRSELQSVRCNEQAK